jgi:integrase
LWFWLADYEAKSSLAAAVRLVMATGQRVEEILRLADPMYRRGEAMLSWDKTKNGLPHAIPLPLHAAEILNRLTPNRHGLYFPNRGHPERPALHPSVRWVIRMFRKETGVEPFSPRDLRRTWKTLAGRAGISNLTYSRRSPDGKGTATLTRRAHELSRRLFRR